jgi:hypothetical protein
MISMAPVSTPVVHIFTPLTTTSDVLILQRRLDRLRRENRNDRHQG